MGALMQRAFGANVDEIAQVVSTASCTNVEVQSCTAALGTSFDYCRLLIDPLFGLLFLLILFVLALQLYPRE